MANATDDTTRVCSAPGPRPARQHAGAARRSSSTSPTRVAKKARRASISSRQAGSSIDSRRLAAWRLPRPAGRSRAAGSGLGPAPPGLARDRSQPARRRGRAPAAAWSPSPSAERTCPRTRRGSKRSWWCSAAAESGPPSPGRTGTGPRGRLRRGPGPAATRRWRAAAPPGRPRRRGAPPRPWSGTAPGRAGGFDSVGSGRAAPRRGPGGPGGARRRLPVAVPPDEAPSFHRRHGLGPRQLLRGEGVRPPVRARTSSNVRSSAVSSDSLPSTTSISRPDGAKRRPAPRPHPVG